MTIYALDGVTEVQQLRRAVEAQYSCRATFSQTIPVRGNLRRKITQDIVVHVFDLEDQPEATRAFAWTSPVNGSDERRLFAVLQVGEVKTPLDAVRAVIAAEQPQR